MDFVGPRRQGGGGRAVPETEEQIAAISEEMPVGAEHFEGDGVVVAASFEGAHVMGGIDGPGSEGEVKVRAAAFIIVKMDMPQPGAVRGQQFVGGVVFHQEVAMTDVEVESQFWNRVEQFGELAN
jgi:hypothetical protein